MKKLWNNVELNYQIEKNVFNKTVFPNCTFTLEFISPKVIIKSQIIANWENTIIHQYHGTQTHDRHTDFIRKFAAFGQKYRAEWVQFKNHY